MISSRNKLVGAPFYAAKLTVFEDGWLPLNHVAKMLGADQTSLQHKLKRGPFEFKKYSEHESPYSIGGGKRCYCNMISRAGLEKLLKNYMEWDEAKIQQGMDLIFEDGPKEKEPRRRRERVIPVHVEQEEEDEEVHSSSPVAKRASPPRKHGVRFAQDLVAAPPIFEQLDARFSMHLNELEARNKAFLAEADARIGESAKWAYMKSPQFETDRRTLLKKEMDTLIPHLRQRLEQDIRAELEPKIRRDLTDSIRKEAEKESETLRRQLRAEAAKNVFTIEAAERDRDPNDLGVVDAVLKKRSIF